MKIRNRYDGTTIESLSSIKEESYFYRLISLGNCNILFKHDGWEEVEDEKWHDLRKNPKDLPKEDEEKLFQIKGTEYPIRGYISDNGKFIYNNDITIVGDTIKIKEVLAWREIPKFNEE